MLKNRKLVAACFLLIMLHVVFVLGPFVAPYSSSAQNRDFPFAPPTRVHFIDVGGHFHLRPFIYAWSPRPDSLQEYDESYQQVYPIRLFVKGHDYSIAGISLRTHLFGVAPEAQVFLAGTDGFGRDQFSRIVAGGRLSIAAGLLATVVSLTFGLLIGIVSGFYGGWIDESAMRFAELFLVLPWLYVLLAVRSFLPLHITATQAFLLLVLVIGTIGWARPARLIRGIVLGAKSRKYVLASRGFGASDWHILVRHILPHTYGVLLTQAALLVPQYILAEVTLSFFGLGLGEPEPSWGNLLANLQHYNVLVSYWWMCAPALPLILISLGYLRVADVIQERVQSASI
jgi:peptide/nickel transport system permease protein